MKIKNPRPKIRKYSVKNIPFFMFSTSCTDNYLKFLPINTKYYEVINCEIDYSDCIYAHLHFILEKLTNLKSLIK